MLRFSSPKRVLLYRTSAGRVPYQEWILTLSDRWGKTRIIERVKRVEDGNLGRHKSVGGGVVELILDFGPGYRLYLGRHGNDLIILLCGGDKSTQDEDIQTAQIYWEDYRRRL